jgi:ubiquinone/menaquinone biosynthesis C-methylase UbiE
MAEMHRVLKQEGTALIIDMNYEATSDDIDNEVRKLGMRGEQVCCKICLHKRRF